MPMWLTRRHPEELGEKLYQLADIVTADGDHRRRQIFDLDPPHAEARMENYTRKSGSRERAGDDTPKVL
jgi:hypothetical protein